MPLFFYGMIFLKVIYLCGDFFISYNSHVTNTLFCMYKEGKLNALNQWKIFFGRATAITKDMHQ